MRSPQSGQRNGRPAKATSAPQPSRKSIMTQMQARINRKCLFVFVPLWASLAPLGEVRADSHEIPIDPIQQKTLLHEAGDGFLVKSTPHFLIAYNTDRDVVDKLTMRFEHTHHAIHRFCNIIGFDAQPAVRRLEAIFFDTWQQYRDYGRRVGFEATGTYGFYHEGTNRSVFFNVLNDPELRKLHANIHATRANLARLEEAVKEIKGRRTPVELRFQDGRKVRLTKVQMTRKLKTAQRELETLNGKRVAYSERINRTVVQHEVAHQVLFNVGIHVRGATHPRWLVEGLACLFETPPGPEGTGFVAINPLRLKDFRSAVAGGTGKRWLTGDDYRQAVSEERIVSLDRLITDPTVCSPDGPRAAADYAASWAFVHYLQRTRGADLATYMRAVASRNPSSKLAPYEERDLVEAHLGPVDEDLVRRFSAYILKLPYRAMPGDL